MNSGDLKYTDNFNVYFITVLNSLSPEELELKIYPSPATVLTIFGTFKNIDAIVPYNVGFNAIW